MTDFMLYGARADFDLIFAGFVAAWSVDDELDVAVFHHVDDIRALVLGKFVETLDFDALIFKTLVATTSGVDFETELGEFFSHRNCSVFVTIVDRKEDVALFWKRVKGANLGLGVSHTEIGVSSHDFAGRFHFWPENNIDARKAPPREDGLFYAEAGGEDLLGKAKINKLFTNHNFSGQFGERNSDGF